MSWSRVLKSAQAFAVHSLLFSFTLLLVLKLDHVISCSWWIIFFPLWMFHAIVARGRFSLPAPSIPHNRHWAPCHAIAAIPLLIAFELLLCVYLESFDVHGFAAVNLKIAVLPLLILEIIILIDNFGKCRALMPRDEEVMNDEAIWETLPHFWVAVYMVFFIAATLFTLLKLCGDVGSLGWWDLFMNFGVAEFFAFLVCTKWSNPVIHRNSCSREASSSSTMTRYLKWNGSLIVSSEENQRRERKCGLQDIGGHFMKVAVIGFQILLCMRLEETPANAKYIPLPVVFSPLFLLQGAGVIFAASRLVERLIILLRSGAGEGIYFRFSSRAHECMGFLHHGSKLLGWWSIDEGSREEQARTRLFSEGASGLRYSFCNPSAPLLQDIAHSVVILLRLLKKCLKRILPRRSGDSRKLLVSRQKLQITAERNLKDFKLRKCYAEFVLRGRLVLYCSRAGIASFAALAQISVRSAQFAVSLLRRAYLYMMFRC